MVVSGSFAAEDWRNLSGIYSMERKTARNSGKFLGRPIAGNTPITGGISDKGKDDTVDGVPSALLSVA